MLNISQTKTTDSKTMRAAVLKSHGSRLVIEDVPMPVISDDEVLIKLEVTGVCHSDIHVTEGDWDIKSPVPIIPGHEGVGIVCQKGSKVGDEVSIGDRVCTQWLFSACGMCEFCIDGCEHACGQQTNCGFTTNGCFAQYVKAPSKFVGIVPKSLSAEQVAPLTCAGMTVYKGLKESGIKPGQWMTINGATGGLGHLAVQYAKAMGMKVIGVDVSPGCEEMMKQLGCDFAINANNAGQMIVPQILQITQGGSHGCMNLVPNNKCIEILVVIARPTGTIVQIGLPPGNMQMNTFFTVGKSLTIKGSVIGTRNDLKEAMEFAADGKVKCKVSVRSFEKVNEVLEDLKMGKVQGRIVLKF